ncbi:TetR family transcriptional regulator [Caviibacterium pharyngocola]|uniref:TetR family transcriptional regulator n=1 Tax=Caviibacterium pharyngocola TaxID=28159 RepID=A0A2M8RW99_9PAST|nr:TetR family transcriptional regulator [Caviibacterium pharyngocola]
MNKNDIRVIKTGKNISESFLALLNQKDFDEITVQDILDRAQINRTTFYKHYAGKNELAKQLIEEFKQRVFLPLVEKRFTQSSMEFTQKFAPVLLENKEKIRLLWKIETPKIHLKQDMYLLIKEKYIENMRNENLAEFVDIEFQGHMYASFALAALSFTLSCDKPLDPLLLLENMRMLFEKTIL